MIFSLAGTFMLTVGVIETAACHALRRLLLPTFLPPFTNIDIAMGANESRHTSAETQDSQDQQEGPEDYYTLLEVSEDATQDEIKVHILTLFNSLST